MKKIINAANMNTITLGFSIDEILKVVYAESALHALNSDLTVKRPLVITEDNNEMLRVIMANGYLEILTSLMGYVSAYDIDEIGEGELTVELMVPTSVAFNSEVVLQHKIELALADYVLSQIYNTECEENARKLAIVYEMKFRNLLQGIICSMALGQ